MSECRELWVWEEVIPECFSTRLYFCQCLYQTHKELKTLTSVFLTVYTSYLLKQKMCLINTMLCWKDIPLVYYIKCMFWGINTHDPIKMLSYSKRITGIHGYCLLENNKHLQSSMLWFILNAYLHTQTHTVIDIMEVQHDASSLYLIEWNNPFLRGTFLIVIQNNGIYKT